MACYHPLQGYQCFDGSVVFTELRRHDVRRSLQLPCGQCVGCRLERSRQWAMRCVHEASQHDRNCFITLTYGETCLPANLSLQYRDFQRFMKRLRKRIAPMQVRFFMCGEYGELNARPHYHACLFGFDFPDKVFLRRVGSGFDLFESKILSDLWPFGFCSLGSVTFESAAYVARYIMKKITGSAAEAHYGERVPEFCHMSLKPGIGSIWFEKYSSDVFPGDYVVINGVKVRPPKYYDRKFTRLDPDSFAFIAESREKNARDRYSDNTDARLVVKEEVTIARLRSLRREL